MNMTAKECRALVAVAREQIEREREAVKRAIETQILRQHGKLG